MNPPVMGSMSQELIGLARVKQARPLVLNQEPFQATCRPEAEESALRLAPAILQAPARSVAEEEDSEQAKLAQARRCRYKQ